MELIRGCSQNRKETLVLTFSVGNKNDDPARKRVDTQDAVHFGQTVGVRVFETSAKENINVEEVTHCYSTLTLGCKTHFFSTMTAFSAVLCHENKALRLKSVFH